jgi:CysZ protein
MPIATYISNENTPKVLKEIIIAIQAYFDAHKFIKKHNLWRWIIIPGIIYCILFFVGMYFFAHTANVFLEWFKGLIGGTLNKITGGFLGFIITMGSFLLWVMMMLFYFSLFKYFFLVLASPIFAYLSEKTEAIIEGKDFPFNLSQLMKDIVRGIKIAFRNGLWQTVYALAIIIVSLIPVLGWFTPILAILIECYYYGFSMLDYSMERHKKSPSESIYYIGNHKGLAVGNGMVFYIMHLLPFVGWVFAPAYAVIAATLSMYPLKEKNEDSKN